MEEERGQGYNVTDSFLDAVSPLNILKRVFLFLVFGVILALKQLISNIDAVGQSGGGLWQYISAMGSAMYAGVGLALGSMWVVIKNPSLYIQNSHWGSIAFSILSAVLLVMFFYQPVSIIINILDGKRGHRTNTLIRLAVALILVMILSGIVFYSVGGDTITTQILGNQTQAVVDTVNQSINQTNVTDTSSVINLL